MINRSKLITTSAKIMFSQALVSLSVGKITQELHNRFSQKFAGKVEHGPCTEAMIGFWW